MAEGLWLMSVGMGTVFSFLTLLVALMYATGAITSLFPEPTQSATGQQRRGASEDLEEEQERLAIVLAVIAAQRSSL